MTLLKPETAILVGTIQRSETEFQVNEYLDELEFLATTAGVVTIKRIVQRIHQPDSRTYIGKGKLDEIAALVEAKQISLAIFDDELSPSQQRNIEAVLKIRVLERTSLILDIFAARARTAYAKVQVELAQYQYLLPRLTRMWTHLERQQGGIGLRGPGETELETDRRVIRTKIARLKEQLAGIDKQMITQRKKRGELVRVALVGYTNVGKSTLMNLMSKSDVFAENKLFATLDTTVRKVTIGNLPFLLSDTVGFIRKLPTSLVESFKSTLDEIREADILLHVVDISHPNFAEQIHIVEETLTEIGAGKKETIMVFNKIDAVKASDFEPAAWIDNQPNPERINNLNETWVSNSRNSGIIISAFKKYQIRDLHDLLYQKAKAIHITRYPYDNLLY